MDISLNASGRDLSPQTLQCLVHKINSPLNAAKLSEYMQRLSEAEALCSAYPNLNKEVVKIGLLLVQLFNRECIKDGLEEVFDILPDIDTEQKVKIVNVMLESQTGYATGEAKIIQYFS